MLTEARKVSEADVNFESRWRNAEGKRRQVSLQFQGFQLQAVERGRQHRETLNTLQKLNDTLHNRIEELDLLHSAGKTLSGIHDLDAALASILAILQEQLRNDVGAVYLFDENERKLKFHKAHPDSLPADDFLGHLPEQLGENIKRDKAILCLNGDLKFPAFRKSKTSHNSHSFIYIPMLDEETLFGVVALSGKTDYATLVSSRKDFFETFAQMAVVNIKNIQMHLSILEKIKVIEEQNRTLEENVEKRTAELRRAYNDLKEAQATLVQSEKMAALGQMVAGVAHEINTPLGYVKNNVAMFNDILDELAETAQRPSDAVNVNHSDIYQQSKELINDSLTGLERISELVLSLKDFSRVDRTAVDSFDVNKGLDDTLKIAASMLKNKVEVLKSYGDVPTIECMPSHINQVFLNLITNAAQAMDKNGKIKITTQVKDHYLMVAIQDNGKGIPEDIVHKICDPFFTTKPVGQGTGLGLSISKKIIEQEHKGRLVFVSKVGKGTAAIVYLPIKASRRETSAPEHARRVGT